jgi:hypothetical protein
VAYGILFASRGFGKLDGATSSDLRPWGRELRRFDLDRFGRRRCCG